ncbi:hypothetical protein Tco_1159367 [Tanacetum coccineum]
MLLSKGTVHHLRPRKNLKTITTSSKREKRHYGLSTMNRQLLDSHRPIPGMTPAEGMAAIASKLDNLGRDMKKLKENVHAIQVGCQLCGGPHLNKECPLNEEVKSMEEVKGNSVDPFQIITVLTRNLVGEYMGMARNLC